MNYCTQSILAAVLLCLCAGAANAQTINQRQRWQDQRIELAYERGALTWREATRLDRRQREIERMERRYRRDGHFSARERSIVQAELDQLSRQIARLSHNHRRPR